LSLAIESLAYQARLAIYAEATIQIDMGLILKQHGA
jgi:hypothetical protein